MMVRYNFKSPSYDHEMQTMLISQSTNKPSKINSLTTLYKERNLSETNTAKRGFLDVAETSSVVNSTMDDLKQKIRLSFTPLTSDEWQINEQDRNSDKSRLNTHELHITTVQKLATWSDIRPNTKI